MATKLDSFTKAYIEAMAFTSEDLGEDNADISDELIDRIVADCSRFQAENAEWIIGEYHTSACDNTIDGQAGHDFWLTRNRHGAGFWDGDWEEPAATKLTAAAHAFGECDVYVGDDGKLYA